MALTTSRGPLGGPDRAGWFSSAVPDDLVYVEPHPRRIVAKRAGAVVLDSERGLLVHRPGRFLTYVFPREDVGDLPHKPEAEAPGFVRVPWDAVDEWWEEGRRLESPYPPNPYHRVDCHPTTRRLTVTAAGTTLVDTDDTTIVFETTLAPVLYVAKAHVRMDLLRPTATTSWCNYKGRASYWAAVVGDEVVEDVAWSYEAPLAESAVLAGFLSFDLTRAEVDAALPSGWKAGRPADGG